MFFNCLNKYLESMTERRLGWKTWVDSRYAENETADKKFKAKKMPLKLRKNLYVHL